MGENVSRMETTYTTELGKSRAHLKKKTAKWPIFEG